MKNVTYWIVSAVIAGVVGLVGFILAVAVLRVAWDALTCPHNLFEREVHPHWQAAP